jgi:hypothetical protein
MAHAARVLGALALLAVGVDHIQQYYADSYSAIPTIGTLFALNFLAAAVIAAGLLIRPRRWAGRLDPLLAASGIAIAASTLAGLLVSEHGGLFGFAEQGYRPAIVLSIALDVAAVAALALFLTSIRPTTPLETAS